MDEKAKAIEDNNRIALHLRARLVRDVPEYIWDETMPPYHSSYDYWHLWGWVRTQDEESYPVTPTSSASYKSNDEKNDRSLNTLRRLSESRGAAVTARVSRHALRLEREFKMSQKLCKEAGENQKFYVRAIKFLKLPPHQPGEPKLWVAIAENPGLNYLLNMVQLGPGVYRAALPFSDRALTKTSHHKIPLTIFMTFAIGASKVLEHYHHNDEMVHGDLRGDAWHFNYETGVVRMISFGSGARAFENGLTSAGWSSLTAQLGVEHKLQYIAPEQTGRLPAEPDSRTDIYSLGILFWSMLADAVPFPGDKPLDIMQNVLSRRIPPIDSRRPDVPQVISRIIQKMTQKNMGDRYHSSAGLRHDLERVNQLLENGDLDSLQNFVLGSKDFSSAFLHPTRLIGREEQLETIRHVMKRAISKAVQRSAVTQQELSVMQNSSIVSGERVDGIAEVALSDSASSRGNRRPSHADVLSRSSQRGDDDGVQDSADILLGDLSLDNKASADSRLSMVSGEMGSSTFSPPSTHESNKDSLLRSARKMRRHGKTEVITISGQAGMGKSSLIQIIQTNARERGYFASARFDPMKKVPFEPAFKIMASLFRQIFSENNVTTDFHHQIRTLVRPIWASLHTALELPVWLISTKQSSKASQVDGGFDTQPVTVSKCGAAGNTAADWLHAGAMIKDKRFAVTFLDFLRLLTMHKFLCFCLDDLQFADSESLDLLQTVINARIPLVMVLTFRTVEDLPRKINNVLRHASKVRLSPFTEDQTSEYIAEILHRSPQYLIPLVAIIQEKTAGIPFFVRELLDRLHKSKCIFYSRRASQWDFNIDAIFDQLASTGSDNFTSSEFIVKRLEDLPQDAKSLLSWASLIGSSFRYNVLYHVMLCDCSKASPAEFLPPRASDSVAGLQAALQSFAIMATDTEDKFRFSHDRYMSAAEALRAPYIENEMHYVLACALMKHDPWDKSRSTQVLFNQSRHICSAIDVVRNRATNYRPFRQLLYEAAETAREQGARQIALYFLKYALALLAEDVWDVEDERADTNYGEVLTLMTQTAGSYWFQGDFDSATRIVDEIFDHTEEATDRSPAYMIKSRICAQRGDALGAFKSMSQALEDLGHKIPARTEEECNTELVRIAKKLAAEQPNVGIDPSTIDRHLITTGAVMIELLSAAFWSNPLVFYRTAIELMHVYMRQGIFPQIALGFIHIASISISRFNMTEIGVKLGRHALRIMDAFPREAYTNGRGLTMHSIFLGHFESNVGDQIPILHRGLEATIAAGDKIVQTLNIGVTAAYRLWASHDLPEIEAFILEQDEQLPSWREDLRGGNMMVAILQYCRALQGKTNYSSPDHVIDDDDHSTDGYAEKLSNKTSLPTGPMSIYRCYLLAALYRFGHYAKALEVGEALMEPVENLLSSRYGYVARFYYSLAVVEHARTTDDKAEKQRLLDIVRSNLQRLEACRSLTDTTFATYCYLLQAEIDETEGRFNACIKLYEAAVNHTVIYGLTLDEALCHELYAEFLIRRGCTRPARNLIDDALTAYRRIGALGKIQQICDKHAFTIHKTHSGAMVERGTQTTEINTGNSSFKLSRNEEELASQTSEDRTNAWLHPLAPMTSTVTRESGAQVQSGLSAVGLDMIDLATILESSQLLSSELDVDKLLKNMVNIIVDGAGAEYGGVVVGSEDSGWSLAALRGPEGEVVDGLGQALQNIPDAVAQQVSLYCLRFREALFISNVLEDERFIVSKKYRRDNPEGRAIIALPILHGDNHLLGCIYIEGPARSFTDRNTAVLRLLVNQISISLANAMLFKRLEKASATNTAMLELQKQALDKAREAERKAKRAEAKAMEMVRLKEEAAKVKSMFLANVSHELRTPLNGVIGMSELLKASQLSKEQEGYADSIRVCADTLLSVINDILDFSKLEAGKMQMFNVPLSLKETISEVVRALSYTNIERGLETIEELEIDSAMLVMGDPVRLHQVFMNLLSNAYKFTAKGKVTVKAVIEQEDDTTIQVLCSVTDTGIGITEEQRKKLFLPFSQADSSTARSYGGTGLGLSICKAIVEIMKGTIWLTSELGVGTTISFTIPFQKVDRSQAVDSNNRSTKQADPMSMYRVATNESPDNSDVQHISLHDIPRDQVKVCIAEDNPINQKIAISFVQKMGLKCSAYPDGQQAFDALVAAAEDDEPFHLVLMDCQMPVLDGYNATREIRGHSDPRVSRVLVIAMTASAIRGDRERCLEAGMNNYLAKPVRANVLKHMLEGYLATDEPVVPDLDGVAEPVKKKVLDSVGAEQADGVASNDWAEKNDKKVDGEPKNNSTAKTNEKTQVNNHAAKDNDNAKTNDVAKKEDKTKVNDKSKVNDKAKA